MSYTRRFSKSITVHYSGSVSYPASQNGGTLSYSGSTNENIHFDVTVDTEPFDEAVDSMKEGVDLLTGSVVATEAAQIMSIKKTSKQIGDTIVSGFFKTVKSDISQQIAQLRIHSESLLLQLNKLAQRCRDKQRQMGADYQRLADRYIKIFNDLSKELENRIFSIDEPVFRVSRTLDRIGSHVGNESSTATASVTAGEQSRLHSMLAVNHLKNRAMHAIEKGQQFLAAQYRTDDVIRNCLLPAGETTSISTPYCIIETTGQNDAGHRELFVSPLLKNIPQDTLFKGIDMAGWSGALSEHEIRSIGDYFNQKVAQQHNDARNSHDHRVADMTANLFNLSQTATPGK